MYVAVKSSFLLIFSSKLKIKVEFPQNITIWRTISFVTIASCISLSCGISVCFQAVVNTPTGV